MAVIHKKRRGHEKRTERDRQVADLVAGVATAFPSFGGGRTAMSNPISEWTKEKPPMFALGVDIESVVRFVLDNLR